MSIQAKAKPKSGFTIVEVMMVVGLLGILLSAALSGWLYVMVGERKNSVQNELDMDVRIAMEYLKNDLRLSSMDQLVFYPDGPGPYTAISFPKAKDNDDDGLIELDADGKIIWDETLVYHIWLGSPNELRLTTFEPRDTSLTADERYAQLAAVVTGGEGAAAENGDNATTRALFRNLFEWRILGKGAIFDTYAAELTRIQDLTLGSVLLGPGSHKVRFEAVDKNASSTGFELGLDTLVATASGYPLEGEALPIADTSGDPAFVEYMAEGSWSGNLQLRFPASSTGDAITFDVDNDRWEETSFKASGTALERTLVVF